jgi:hypothetical protein
VGGPSQAHYKTDYPSWQIERIVATLSKNGRTSPFGSSASRLNGWVAEGRGTSSPRWGKTEYSEITYTYQPQAVRLNAVRLERAEAEGRLDEVVEAEVCQG